MAKATARKASTKQPAKRAVKATKTTKRSSGPQKRYSNEAENQERPVTIVNVRPAYQGQTAATLVRRLTADDPQYPNQFDAQIPKSVVRFENGGEMVIPDADFLAG